MAIDGFDFTTISDGRVDPDSPLDTTLATDWRDNSEFLMRWLGKSFLGAAVADHDHDGTNSAQVDASDLTGTAIVNAFVWVDDGTLVVNDTGGSGTTGLVSVASQVPVGALNVELAVKAVGDSTTDLTIGYRQPGSGTYRLRVELEKAELQHRWNIWAPLNGSRQFDMSANTNNDQEVRGYQL